MTLSLGRVAKVALARFLWRTRASRGSSLGGKLQIRRDDLKV